ncbi:tumor necrosis factor receptor superfamily member 6 [Acanthopagrus latus]|uniref:tumor necrosis factor receptor superfamily member 6 n=1 Tax=Acanthopagrus latus TaxID=8177 RepID=UPI00187CE5E0|nr:tumor necrosis factor receptor superfamily member 6 [Acanthopagrus latus]
MAAHANKCPVLVFAFVLFSQLMSGAVASSQCVDGTYDHGELKCCKCGIGLYVKEHCTANLQFGQCEPCNAGTFSSHPTGQTYCEPCTSCSHVNANLEVEEECTSAVNRKCRCKKDHYCISPRDTCKLCSPCATCPEGIKVPCIANNNTVCNEEQKEANNTGTVVGIIIAIVLIAVVGVAVWYYRRKQQRQNLSFQHPNGTVDIADVELNEGQRLIKIPDMDLQSYIPTIAEVIGWNDMKDIAIRSRIPMTKIDDCRHNNPNNAGEQTVELLGIWVESQGLAAGDKLYQLLETTGKKLKADKVRGILLPG